MAERLRELRNARGVAKRQITLLERFLDARSPDTSIYVIEARFETLTTIKADFETVQKELERLDPTELVEPEDGQLNERESFENRFIQVKASFQQILRENPDSSFNPSHNSTIVELGADLPKFDIPEFHGGYGEYNTFMDIFDTLVHNSPARSMTNVKRMGYLKGACKGRASDVIKHLQLTNENYEVARSLLKERFSNPRLTFQECIDKIWDVPKASSASSLRAVSDLFNSQLKALERLGTREEIADGILIHLALSKFDSTSKSKWEEHLASSTAIPKWDNLIKFLNKRCTVWEAIEVTKIPIKNSSPTQKNKPSEHLKRNYAISSENPKCLMCQSNCADLVNCKKFMDLAPKKRSTLARQWNLCYTCLQPKHETDCTSPNCSHCGRNHHTILHYGKIPSNHVVPHDVTTQSVSIAKIRVSDAWKRNKKTNVNKNVQIESTFVDLNKNYCFLATAVVLVKNNFGDYVPMRVLLDGAAQTSFITAKAAKCLGLPQLQTHVQVAGVHGNPKLLTKAVKLEIKSRLSESTGECFAIVNPFYKDTHPSKNIDTSDWNIPSNIQLADPKFNVPQEIDILINAHLTYEWQFVGQIKLGKDKPIAQKTMLGWVIVGNFDSFNKSTPSYKVNLISTGSLHATMEKFWSVEELVAPAKKFTKEERECEIHFQNNVQRTDDGRIVVRLPFKINPEQLGHSYDIAKRRLYQISRKFTQDCQMSQHYHQFMQEYQELGHMKSSTAVRHSYYIPHFSVLNPGSTTTSFRVVFDASAATETGLSLNDALMVGPCIQRELFTHLLTFRCKPIALTGDISKMYRQIAIHEDDQKWQKILWYKNNHLQEFQLTTVTYGTASASFLATRALQYLADQEDIMLTGANAIRDNMYVDDLITCANTVDEAIQIYREVTAILKKGQMPIRKFCSNSSDVLAAIPSELHGTKLQVGDKDLVKALGMLWDPHSDNFLYYHEQTTKPVTKKGILSEVASLFDPLGLLAPVTVTGKMFMQELWTTKLAWDESLPQSLATAWDKLRKQLPEVNKITISRVVMMNPQKIVVHGFADASKKAYAAVLYVSSRTSKNKVVSRILCAKTKVAPLKTVTLPRLELLGALLLARLHAKVTPMLPTTNHETFLWVDASIALTWIRASPHKWSDYVGTRVTEIQNLTNNCEWRHVPTDQNPADIASRGMLPSQLSESSMWFNGPPFINKPQSEWPNRFELVKNVPEVASHKKVLSTKINEFDLVRQSKFHSWLPLQKVFGYVARFLNNVRNKKRPITRWKTNDPLPQSLSTHELHEGLKTAVKIVQRHHFQPIIDAILKKEKIDKRHPIARLHPVVGTDGILRVGGRLVNACDVEEDTKFPIVIPSDHPLTQSLFLYCHAQELMHAGPRAVLGHVYLKFWPLKGKTLANRIIRNCLRCQWVKPTVGEQLMGPLPKYRVSVVDRPFLCTGVDFFEPLWVTQPGRGNKRVRAYGAVFVCFTTKAVHIELVDDLSTPGFINAMQRFVSRRGCPKKMYSDNGKNFVGARNLLCQWQEHYQDNIVYEWCRNKGIEWEFIPPRTPHQAGLMEAAVKSTKFHLIRAIGETSLFRAELETVLVTVEAILNSRPLVPVSMNPKDDSPLTPAHFIIGSPLKSFPEPLVLDHNLNNLERFKRVMFIKQSFWERWSKEYRHTMMNRNKWMFDQPNLLEGTIVLLVDRNAKPLTWKWGKIISVHQNRDGKIRRVTVKTTSGTYERGITEVCPLPFNEDQGMAQN